MYKKSNIIRVIKRIPFDDRIRRILVAHCPGLLPAVEWKLLEDVDPYIRATLAKKTSNLSILSAFLHDASEEVWVAAQLPWEK